MAASGVPALALLLLGCGPLTGSASPVATRSSAGLVSTSLAPTATPTTAATAMAVPVPVVASPTATVTPGPVAYVLDFSANRRDLTMKVGQRLELHLSAGTNGGWISGVDNAAVLAPVSPQPNGIYQALAPGTALVTAHVPFGCANTSPSVPCRPERGLWFQMRVYVTP